MSKPFFSGNACKIEQNCFVEMLYVFGAKILAYINIIMSKITKVKIFCKKELS